MIQELKNRMAEVVAAIDENIRTLQALKADIESEERQLAREKTKCAELISNKAIQLSKILANGSQVAAAETAGEKSP